MEIIINSKELKDNNLVDIVKDTFDRMIVQLNKLNLSSLQFIIVPDDFGEELIHFQREHGLREGYTNNEIGTAMGKVLTYVEDGIVRSSIFFNWLVIFTLFDKDKNPNAVHTLHHEFCHVHDDYIKYKAFGVTNPEDLFLDTTDRVGQISYAHAELIWSEYIATRISSDSRPLGHDMYVNSLIELLPTTQDECEAAILRYRTERDLLKLFGEIQLSRCLFSWVLSWD